MSPAVPNENEYSLRPKAFSIRATNAGRHARPPRNINFSRSFRIKRLMGGPACRRPFLTKTNTAFGRRPFRFAPRTAGDTPALPFRYAHRNSLRPKAFSIRATNGGQHARPPVLLCTSKRTTAEGVFHSRHERRATPLRQRLRGTSTPALPHPHPHEGPHPPPFFFEKV